MPAGRHPRSKRSNRVLTELKPVLPAAGQRKGRGIDLKAPPVAFEDLQKLRQDEVQRLNKREKTDKCYSGHLQRAMKFLEEVVADRRAKEIVVCEDGVPTEDLAHAFDQSGPNRWSVYAIELFLAHQCFARQLGKSTADGIQAAFCRYWDVMGDQYCKDYYCWDDATQTVDGNPARARTVMDLVKSVGIRTKQDHRLNRNHAEAMSIEEFKKLQQTSEMICPDAYLIPGMLPVQDFDLINAALGNPGRTAPPLTPLEWHKLTLFHGMFRAVQATSWTLWSRCYETATIQYGDLTFGCVGPSPMNSPYFQVHLFNRKGWQNQQGYDGPRSNNVYNIYQQDIPEIDMYTHLLRWIAFLEWKIGRKLEPDDYIFPHISSNGVIDTHTPMSYRFFASMLTDMTYLAKIDNHFTTHSYRRGASQWRFMYCPPHLRWTLNRIRWWGGWAPGEGVDVMIRYLVDALNRYEQCHSDALAPVPHEINESELTSQKLTNATARECVRRMTEVCQQIELMKKEMQNLVITASSSARLQPLSFQSSQVPLQPSSIANTAAPTSFPHWQTSPAMPHYASGSTVPGTVAQIPLASTSNLPPPPSATVRATKPKPVPRKVSNKDLAPPCHLQDVIVPDIPPTARADAWRLALKQWEEPNPVTGLIPLRDWPPHWYTGKMTRYTGTKRRNRELVALAYEQCYRDDNLFKATYPEADTTLSALLDAIRARLKLRRESKNGTPQERDSSRNDD